MDAPVPVVRPSTHRRARTFAEKLQEIQTRSPKDYAALEQLADHVLTRLDADQHQARKPG